MLGPSPPSGATGPSVSPLETDGRRWFVNTEGRPDQRNGRGLRWLRGTIP